MFTYKVTSGELRHNGELIGAGYSGHGAGLNNPLQEKVRGVGPLPRGKYKIGPAYDDPHLGTCVMHLDPDGWDAFGRSLFRMHGDNAELNHTASDGCIIMGRTVRGTVATSGDDDLEVI